MALAQAVGESCMVCAFDIQRTAIDLTRKRLDEEGAREKEQVLAWAETLGYRL